MPNWCFANYVIEGDHDEVADLYQKMTGLLERKESLVENGTGKNWLGNVAEMFGKPWNDIDCRGEFDDLDLIDGNLQFSTMTAWSECSDLWDFVLSRYKTLRIYYSAEEGGCCYYRTNDVEGKYFPERYKLDTDSGSHYFETEAETLKAISEMLEREIKTIEEIQSAIDEREEENPDNCMSFNKIEVVNPDSGL